MNVFAWHWTGADMGGQPVLRDWRPVPPAGKWLVHDGSVALCERGLHASIDILNGLRYAPGCWLHRVECSDVVSSAADKLVCRRRRVVASADMTWALVTGAEWCATRAASAARYDSAATSYDSARYAADAAANYDDDAAEAASDAAEAASDAASYASTERAWQVETLELLFMAVADESVKGGAQVNTSTGLTGIIIQLRRLEARQHAADYRLAVWTVLAFVVGLAAGIAAATWL